jgi:hypothetical protein
MPVSEMSAAARQRYLKKTQRTVPEDMSRKEMAEQVRCLRSELYRTRTSARNYRNGVQAKLREVRGFKLRMAVFEGARKMLIKSGRPDYVFELAERIVDKLIGVEDMSCLMIWNIVRNCWRRGKMLKGCRYEEAILLATASLARRRSATQVTQVLSHEGNICLPDERTHKRHTAKHRLADVGAPGVHVDSCCKYFERLALEHDVLLVRGDAMKLGHGDVDVPDKFIVGSPPDGGCIVEFGRRAAADFAALCAGAQTPARNPLHVPMSSRLPSEAFSAYYYPGVNTM